MDIYTINSDRQKEDELDMYETSIWTERFYGDGDFELKFDPTEDIIAKVPKGRFVGMIDSPEPMVIQTHDIEDDVLTVTGITITKWFNNRFVRTNNNMNAKFWALSGMSPGETMQHIVQNFCIDGPYLDGSTNTGLNGQNTRLRLPGLITGAAGDSSAPDISIEVPYAPVYDALREIATTYTTGIRTVLVGGYFVFYAYVGFDKTSDQSVYPVVQFSAEMESLTGIKELSSIAEQRNVVFAVAPSAPVSMIPDDAGFSMDGDPTGFEALAEQIFVDELPASAIVGSAALNSYLDKQARQYIKDHPEVKLVDGEIVSTEQLHYGSGYYLGDVIELKGHSGNISKARITEYIRSKDSSGSKAYPTLEFVE